MTDHGPQDERPLITKHPDGSKPAPSNYGTQDYLTTPSVIAQERAAEFLIALGQRGVVADRYSWSAVGGIGVTIRGGKRKAYVEFYNDGSARALMADDGSQEMHTRCVTSFHTVIDALKEYLYDH